MQIEQKVEQTNNPNQQKTKKLWGNLKKFLLKKDDYTIHQQLYLNIIPQITLENDLIQYDFGKDGLQVLIKKQRTVISLEEMKKFNESKVDSTGVSLWPAEELLAYYCLKNIDSFKSFKRIAEYGAGYSGLAGLALSKLMYDKNKYEQDFTIEISDGNEECANLLRQNILQNYPNFKDNFQIQKMIQSKQYIWDENGIELEEKDKFDCIIIADCLFFRNYHNALIKTLQNNLAKSGGFCIIIAPQRGGTLQEFLQKCQNKLEVNLFKFEDDTYRNIYVKNKNNPQFNEDTHDYFFLKIQNIQY